MFSAQAADHGSYLADMSSPELQSSLPGSSLGFGGRRGSEMSTSGTELPYRRSHLIYDRTGATSPGANSSTESTSKAVSSRVSNFPTHDGLGISSMLYLIMKTHSVEVLIFLFV